MRYTTVKKFALAISHIVSASDQCISPGSSTITDIVESTKEDEEPSVLLAFNINGIQHVVRKETSGFKIIREGKTELNFIQWECDECGLVINGSRTLSLDPFKTYKLEFMRTGVVVVTCPIDHESTNLHVVTFSEMVDTSPVIVSSIASHIVVAQPSINIEVLFREWTPLVLILLPELLNLKTDSEDQTHVCLTNLMSLQADRFSLILGTYKGHAVSFYINILNSEQSDIFIRTVHSEATFSIQRAEFNHKCRIDGDVPGKKISYEFVGDPNGYVYWNTNTNAQPSSIRAAFSGRTIHAILD